MTYKAYYIGNYMNDYDTYYGHDNINRPDFSLVDRFPSYKDGEWKIYHENGKLKEVGNYSDNSEIGEWKEYDIDGNITNTREYLNGRPFKGRFKFEFYLDGYLIENYIEGKKTGESKMYSKNGKLEAIGNYINDKNTNLVYIKLYLTEKKIVS